MLIIFPFSILGVLSYYKSSDDVFNFDNSCIKDDVDTEPVLEAIKLGDTQRLDEESDKIIGLLSHKNKQSYIRDISMEMIISSVRVYCEIYGSLEDIFEDGSIPFAEVMNAHTDAELFIIVRTVMSRIAERISDKQNSQTRKVIQRAFDYVNQNFQKDITLNDVANYVYMSP